MRQGLATASATRCAAHLLRNRYHELLKTLTTRALPQPLYPMVPMAYLETIARFGLLAFLADLLVERLAGPQSRAPKRHK
jgi:hypothetical protein